MVTSNRPQQNDPARQVNKSTNPAQNRNAFYIAIAGAVIALIAVIGFNVMAPKGRLDSPGATSSTPASGSTVPGGTPAQQATPQRGDTPTAPGREAMGAPVGAVPAPASPASN